jgi:hypothetical protein
MDRPARQRVFDTYSFAAFKLVTLAMFTGSRGHALVRLSTAWALSLSAERPWSGYAERRLAQPSTSWHARVIGEVDLDDDLLRPSGQVVEHDLGAPEHRERPAGVTAPGEIDEAGTPSALHDWPAKVAAVGANVSHPLRTVRVSGNEIVWAVAEL